jgi:hypothetical protein
MNQQKTSITDELRELFNKTTEANKIFMSESAKFVTRLDPSKLKAENLASLPKELLTDAFTAFVKLNIQYTSNLIDLGLAMTRRLNQEIETKKNTSESQQEFSTAGKPAFVLNLSGAPATVVNTQFLLDNDKTNAVSCELKQTEYILETDPSVKANFETIFLPSSFQLLPGQPQKIDISVKIPPGIKEGTYLSNMEVEPVEHSFFSLYLTITAPQDFK